MHRWPAYEVVIFRNYGCLQGTPYPAGVRDLQSWIRGAAIAPDWERIGADLIGSGQAYNQAFTIWVATNSA